MVATGGLAVPFADGTDVFDHIDPDFTVKGLAALYSDWAKTQAGKFIAPNEDARTARPIARLPGSSNMA